MKLTSMAPFILMFLVHTKFPQEETSQNYKAIEIQVVFYSKKDSNGLVQLQPRRR